MARQAQREQQTDAKRDMLKCALCRTNTRTRNEMIAHLWYGIWAQDATLLSNVVCYVHLFVCVCVFFVCLFVFSTKAHVEREEQYLSMGLHVD